MFVKKFEAPSLEQALKMVKLEMGPEALVLSTQERRTGKLFSRRFIEVTAASEAKRENKKAPQNEKNNNPRVNLAEVFPERTSNVKSFTKSSSNENVSVAKSKVERYVDIESDSLPGFQMAQIILKNETVKYEAGFKGMGISNEHATQLAKRMVHDFSKTDLSNPSFLAKAKIKVLTVGLRTLSAGEFFKRADWIPIGISGSGKTTTLVKLAILAKEQEKSVSLVSMDNRKVVGRTELSGYARLIRIPFFTEVNHANPEKLKLIDCPALNLTEGDNTTLEKLALERSSFIVLDASSRLSELMRQVQKAMVFSPDAIAFTKLDSVHDRGVIYDVLKMTQLPLLGISISSSFKTKFRFFTPTELAQFLTKE
ncbi:MAG: hypothetical protein EXR74_01340 [Bdellovibrionales bacterium]|nr:hypothetical protein [Bdellovibrionales bacterium]